MDIRNTRFSCKAEVFEAADDTPTNPSTAPTLGDVVNTRFGRREMMRGALAVTAAAATFGPTLMAGRPAQAATSRYVWDEISHASTKPTMSPPVTMPRC